MRDDDELPEHPGLKNFNQPLEYIKHVAGKAIKWGAIAALIGGLAVGLIPGAFTALGSFTSLIPGVGATVTNWFASGALTSFMTGAIWAGMAGGAIGAISGMADAGDAVDEAAEQRIAAYERREVRQQRLAMLDQRREQARLNMAQRAQAMGLTPGHGLPMEMDDNSRGMV